MTQSEQTKMLSSAYALLCEFQDVIHTQLEGDHQMANSVDVWLTLYEQMERHQAATELNKTGSGAPYADEQWGAPV